MKRLLFSLLLVSLAFPGFAQDLKEVMLTNQIKEVTLFLSGAQVFETATGTLPAGESVLLVKGLSPFLDEKSIQVKGQGNFIIQAVNKRLDFLHEKEEGEKAKTLEKEIAEIEKRQETVAQERGFRINDHSLHIYADCIRPECPRKCKP